MRRKQFLAILENKMNKIVSAITGFGFLVATTVAAGASMAQTTPVDTKKPIATAAPAANSAASKAVTAVPPVKPAVNHDKSLANPAVKN
jgi:hypothetical protein